MLPVVQDTAGLRWLLRPAAASPAPGPLRAGRDQPRAVLAAMARDGLLAHVAGDVYLPADLTGVREHRLAALALLVGGAVGEDAVVGLLAAAWAHGARTCPDPVALLVPRWSHAPLPDGVREHESVVPPEHVVRAGGLRLTSPARTAADVARWLPPREAEPVLADLLATGVTREEVLAVLDGQRRVRHARRARTLVRAIAPDGVRTGCASR
jgi:hypothetical protein